METIATNCKIESYSVSEATRYFIESIRAVEYENKKTLLNKSEIVRRAIDFYVSKNYPHFFNEVKELVK